MLRQDRLRIIEQEKKKVHTRTPNIRVAIEVSPLPVPRSLAGNISGEIAYRTPYIICHSCQVNFVIKEIGRLNDLYITEQ